MKSKELAMLITIGLLLAVTVRLESIKPDEYTPLPSVLISSDDSSSCTAQWEDASETVIVSQQDERCRLRVRLELKGEDVGEAKEHAAFVVNTKSWIDGGDGWLYYRDTLEKDEMTEPICLQGYLDRKGKQKQIYAALVCDWMPVKESTG